MATDIIWLPEAERTYENILSYLSLNWTEKEERYFVKRVNEVIADVAQNHYLYPRFAGRNIFKAVISWQTSLLYRVKNDKIELLIFWDNRQNPKSLRKHLK